MEESPIDGRGPGDKPFGFLKLDVYRTMLEYLELEHRASGAFPADLRDQLDRAANSMILNFGEGAGKKARSRDRGRYYGISNGSATESAAGWDVARIRGYTPVETCREAQDLLGRITAMLSKMKGG